MRIVDCTQGEADWLQIRAGRVTASEIDDATSFLVRTGKNGRVAGDSSAAREKYKAALVAEILTGEASQHYVNRWMERGTALEPHARQAYEQRHDVMVGTVGFILHPTIDRSGASPDGLIDMDGGLEIKCPKIETHIGYIRAGRLPPEYEPQVMWNLACSERAWWDFVSFCPEMPERHQQFRIRVERDEKRIAELTEGVLKCLAEVDDLIAELDRINPPLSLRERMRQSVEAEPFVSTGDFEQDWRAVADSLAGEATP